MNDEVSTLGESYDQIRRAVLDLLTEHCNRRGRREQLSVERDVERVLAELGLTGPPRDRTRVLAYQIYHELHLERLIFPGIPVEMGSHNMQWPFYQITGHGRQVLQNREYSPYDPDGYLRRLTEEIAGIDETIIRYVEESLKCLRTNCLLAAAVTMGCASEKAMLLLIDEFGNAISDATKKGDYEKKTGNG